MDEHVRKFNRYLVMFGPDEGRTGIKGIRSDAPEEAKEAYIEWFRDKNRYPNGRKYSRSSRFVQDQIIDVSVVDREQSDEEGDSDIDCKEAKKASGSRVLYSRPASAAAH